MSTDKPRTNNGVTTDLFDCLLERNGATNHDLNGDESSVQTVDSSGDAVEESNAREQMAHEAAVSTEATATVTPAGEEAGPSVAYGRLGSAARRCLVRLLQHGVILARDHKLLYEDVIRNESALRHHLADMYLDMLIDKRAELVILKQQIGDDLDSDSDEQTHPTLIRRRPLTLYDSIVLIVLRKHYQQRENAGETRVIVERAQIEALLTPFLSMSNNSRLDKKKLAATLKKFEPHKVIANIRGDDERIEITPVIRYVVNAEFLGRLEKEYLNLVGDSSHDVSDDGEHPS